MDTGIVVVKRPINYIPKERKESTVSVLVFRASQSVVVIPVLLVTFLPVFCLFTNRMWEFNMIDIGLFKPYGKLRGKIFYP